jgi:anti-sigma B factor antagonist
MATFSLEIDFGTHGDHSELRVTGEVDVKTAAQIAESGRIALTERPGHPLVVDLGRVTFMDSTGLGVLVDLRRIAAEFGAELRLRDVPPRVQKILAITALDAVFAVEPSPGAAKR